MYKTKSSGFGREYERGVGSVCPSVCAQFGIRMLAAYGQRAPLRSNTAPSHVTDGQGLAVDGGLPESCFLLRWARHNARRRLHAEFPKTTDSLDMMMRVWQWFNSALFRTLAAHQMARNLEPLARQ